MRGNDVKRAAYYAAKEQRDLRNVVRRHTDPDFAAALDEQERRAEAYARRQRQRRS